MTWSAETSNGREAQKMVHTVAPYMRGVGMDIGCGPQRVSALSIGVDRQVSPQGANIACDVADLSMFADDCMDYVFSSHVLEDFPQADAPVVLAEWFRLLKSGGYLILCLPEKGQYPDVGEPGCNPAHHWTPTREEVIEALPDAAEVVFTESRHERDEYSFTIVARKGAATQVEPPTPEQLGEKDVLVVRYGGFGDMVQASSIFTELKAQGYNVYVNCTVRGYDIIKEDPRVSGFWLQQEDFIANGELSEYWANLERDRFARVINLSESVEGTLLTIPGRPSHHWEAAKRKFLLDHNYLELTHAIAGVEYKPDPQFVPTEFERKWAEKTRARLGKNSLVVMLAVAGSSIHKFYPHMDNFIASLMISPLPFRVVLVGDHAAKILETGWENEQRVWKRCGEWSIRQTLAFAQTCDAVVGPETGVLNAVAFNERVSKVVLLSHSSHNNLTRDWKRTTALSPTEKEVPCYPCHKMVYGSADCWLDDETGAAMCAAKIPHETVLSALMKQIGPRAVITV